MWKRSRIETNLKMSPFCSNGIRASLGWHKLYRYKTDILQAGDGCIQVIGSLRGLVGQRRRAQGSAAGGAVAVDVRVVPLSFLLLAFVLVLVLVFVLVLLLLLLVLVVVVVMVVAVLAAVFRRGGGGLFGEGRALAWRAWRAWTVRLTAALYLKMRKSTGTSKLVMCLCFLHYVCCVCVCVCVCMCVCVCVCTWCRGSFHQIKMLVDEGLTIMNSLHIDIFFFHGVKLQQSRTTY